MTDETCIHCTKPRPKGDTTLSSIYGAAEMVSDKESLGWAGADKYFIGGKGAKAKN